MYTIPSSAASHQHEDISHVRGNTTHDFIFTYNTCTDHINKGVELEIILEFHFSTYGRDSHPVPVV